MMNIVSRQEIVTSLARASEIIKQSRRAFLAGVAAVAAGLTVSQANADTAFTTFQYPATLPNRTGTTPSSQSAPAREGAVANVIDFGADPTGSVDSQPAIQAAVNWQVANGNRGAIYIPYGRYLVNSAVVIPPGSFRIYGDCDGSFLISGFNGFVLDQLTNPYSPAGDTCSIENLHISNSYVGQNSNQSASSSWVTSASPVTINVPSLNAFVAANCLVYIIDQRIAPMPVFVGIVSSVVAGTSITLPTTAVGSGGFTNLGLAFVQCYAAAASWVNNATTITMPGSPPTGVPTNCLVFDYDKILAGAGGVTGLWVEALGVGNWSGSTVTFTAGVSQASVGSADRLVFAPLAGAIRMSSTVTGNVRNCQLGGFHGFTTSEDNVNTSGLQQGAQAFSILLEENLIKNATHAAAIGSQGIYLTNNSVSLVNDLNGWWVGTRISGIANSIIGGRCEVCTFGIALGAETNASNVVGAANLLAGFSLESHVYAIVWLGGGHAHLDGLNILCQNNNGLQGVVIGGGAGDILVSNCAISGNWQGYGMSITQPGNTLGGIVFIGTTVTNNFISNQGWKLPTTQAWWGTCIACNNPALTYAFSALPSGVSSPTPNEGDTYDITDCPNSGSNPSFLTAVTAGGGTGTFAHRRVRYNAAVPQWEVVG